MPPQAVASFLAQTAVLSSVSPEVLGKLAPHVEQQVVPAGKPLVGAGAIVTTLGFLRTGRAAMQIVDAVSGSRTTLEEILPGDVFGEVGLVLGAASPIVVMAEEDCETLVIQKAHFDKICAAVPDALQAIAKRIGTRFVKVSLLGGKKAGARAVPPEPAAGGVAGKNASMPTQPGAPLPKGAVPFVEIANYDIGPKLLELMASRVILEHRVLPLEARGHTLVVGMVSPHSLPAKEAVRRALHSVDPEIVAISADDFSNAVLRLKLDVRDQRPAGAAGAMSRALRPQYAAETKKEAEKQLQVMIGDEVVQLLDRILTEAVDRGVSDVHIEPESSGVRVRFRSQGMLVDRKEMIPASFGAPLAARVKVLAELDITDSSRTAFRLRSSRTAFRLRCTASSYKR
jgi:CRP-like cAMP-binding protein